MEILKFCDIAWLWAHHMKMESAALSNAIHIILQMDKNDKL